MIWICYLGVFIFYAIGQIEFFFYDILILRDNNAVASALNQKRRAFVLCKLRVGIHVLDIIDENLREHGTLSVNQLRRILRVVACATKCTPPRMVRNANSRKNHDKLTDFLLKPCRAKTWNKGSLTLAPKYYFIAFNIIARAYIVINCNQIANFALDA